MQNDSKSQVMRLLAQAKQLAQEYRALTGKPLGMGLSSAPLQPASGAERVAGIERTVGPARGWAARR
jgi:hypothetical protein